MSALQSDALVFSGPRVISPTRRASRRCGTRDMDACEQVLTDAMGDDAARFTRQDCVEDAALNAAKPFFECEPTLGPGEAGRMTQPGGWQSPVVTRD